MQTILFFFQRFFIFLADLVLVPSRWFLTLWRNPNRGRALIFGIPAFLMAFLMFSALLWSWVGNHGMMIRKYEDLAKLAEEKATEASKVGDQKAFDEQIKIAEVYWYKLRSLDPKNLDYLYGLFAVAIKKRDVSSAHEIFKTLAPNDKAVHLKSHLLRAELLLRDKNIKSSEARLKDARNQLELALKLRPSLTKAQLRLADVDYFLGNKNKALATYEEYFRQYPVFVFKIYMILYEQGKIAEGQEYLTEGKKLYEKLIEDYPNNVGLYERYARCYILQGEHEKAEAILLDKRTRLAKDNTIAPEVLNDFDNVISNIYAFWAKEIVARELSRKGELSDAVVVQYLQLLKEGLQRNNQNQKILENLTTLGNSKFVQAAEAREIFDPRINPASVSVKILLLAGSFELLEGDFKTGVDMLSIAERKAPNNPIVLNNLAFALRTTDSKRSLELINRALRVTPNNPRLLDTRGQIHTVREEYYEAIRDLTEAEKLGMTNRIEIHRALAFCYNKVNLTDSAQMRIDAIKKLESQGTQQPVPPLQDSPDNDGRVYEGTVERGDSGNDN